MHSAQQLRVVAAAIPPIPLCSRHALTISPRIFTAVPTVTARGDRPPSPSICMMGWSTDRVIRAGMAGNNPRR